MTIAEIRFAKPEDASAIDAAGYEWALHHFQLAPAGLLMMPLRDSHEWSEVALAVSPESVCFVAESHGAVIGYVHAIVVLESRPMFVSHRYGRIETVAVLPRFRTHGVGSALMDTAEQWLVKQECEIARLSVFAANQGAVSLHEARGYQPLVKFLQKTINDGA